MEINRNIPELDYVPFTNDLLFHMVFSKNEIALRNLLSSLLDIPENDIIQITVLNPVQYADAFDTKITVLDLKLHLNGERYIIIEMQVRRFTNLTNRTLVYTCRQLVDQTRGKGFQYSNLQPVIQIAIMDHTLFPDHKRFITKYELRDDEGYQYSDKLQFIVMDLTAKGSATDQDRKKGLVDWAAAFNAKDWDTVGQIENQGVKEAKKTMELIMATPTERQLLMEREFAELDRQALIEDAISTGIQEGLKKGMQEGRKEGRKEGINEGITEGVDQMGNLMALLFDQNRFEDAKRCAKDPNYRNQLMKELL